MEQQNIKFVEYKFDSTPYVIAANSFSKQFKDIETKNKDLSKYAFDQLDSSISLKINERSITNENLKKIQTEILKIQMELDTLKREEEQLSCCSFDLKEGNFI